MPGVRIRSFVLLTLLVALSVYSSAEDEGNEYNVKAMFVLNFMKYIEWPVEATDGEFQIGVIGESDIYGALIAMAANRHDKRPIRIKKVSSANSSDCRILIISRSQNKKVEEWARLFQGKGVLLISEDCKSANGAAINLLNVNNKIRFEINNTQAHLGGIKISSRLAELAVSVQP
jgi:hypothetical protein